MILDTIQKHQNIVLIAMIVILGGYSLAKSEINQTQAQKMILEYQANKESNIQELQNLKKDISERIKKQEEIEKINECYDNQVQRIMNGEEIDQEYCEEMTQIQEKEEYNERVEKAKTRCYERKADLNLEGKDLENFCEDPFRLGKFDNEEPKAPQSNPVQKEKAPEKQKIPSISKKIEKKENLDKKKQLSAYRHEWNDERNEWISYMYEKSGYDKDMVLTFLSENDTMGLNRPSIEKGKDGNRAYGICQLYKTYHKKFINSEDFQDPYKQMDYCIGVWKDAKKRGIIPTTFYAYSFRYNASKKIVFVK